MYASRAAKAASGRNTRMAAMNGSTREPKPLNDTFSSLPTTIHEVMTQLSITHDSVNLGQGFPDAEGPDSMKRIAGDALLKFPNQYAPLMGVQELRNGVANFAQAAHPEVKVDPQREVLITLGATEALSSAMLALLNPGDQVIIFDPAYDAYNGMCRRAGGIPKVVPLEPETWEVQRPALESAFSSNTKLLLLNSPHNPTGKVFSKPDLEYIAQLCVEHNVYVLSDEVYEHLVFPGSSHVSVRSLPGMADRTLRIGSAGKTFSLTAWKIGWVTGPAPLVAAVAKAHQFTVFCIPSNLQRGVAFGLQGERHFYETLGQSLQGNRDYLKQRLQDIGFRVIPGQGTYFLVADFRPLRASDEETDVDFCRRLTVEACVTVLPITAFYNSPGAPNHLVRFCFCKSMSKLTAACDQMEEYFADGRKGC